MSKDLVVEVDFVNEHVLLAAGIVSREHRRDLVKRVPAESFQDDQHRAGWRALRELESQGLEFDPATFAKLLPATADVAYFVQLAELRPDPPANLEFHVEALAWDRQRVSAARGPIKGLLEAINDPTAPKERVRALARHVGESFDGGAGAGRWLHDRGDLVRDQMADLDARIAGRASYPYGIAGLDEYESGASDDRGRDIGGTRRMLPGAAPGMVTMIAGQSGAGKSTFAAHISLGQVRQKKPGMYCAWEPKGGMTLELMACISLKWSRSSLIQGLDQRDGRSPMPPDQRVQLEDRMHLISRWVTFMRNPYRRQRSERATNMGNLDILQEQLASVPGCKWFICDLWDRCLEEDKPSDEKKALFRQQAMAEEMDMHCVLLAQQRKDVEGRQDKRPTREGITGSGAWTQVADTILAPYRPGQWKRVLDDKIELHILKQRWGRWPLSVEFDWDGDKGSIANGRSVEYEHPGEAGGIGDQELFKAPTAEAGRGRKKWGR